MWAKVGLDLEQLAFGLEDLWANRRSRTARSSLTTNSVTEKTSSVLALISILGTEEQPGPFGARQGGASGVQNLSRRQSSLHFLVFLEAGRLHLALDRAAAHGGGIRETARPAERCGCGQQKRRIEDLG